MMPPPAVSRARMKAELEVSAWIEGRCVVSLDIMHCELWGEGGTHHVLWRGLTQESVDYLLCKFLEEGYESSADNESFLSSGKQLGRFVKTSGPRTSGVGVLLNP